MRSVRRIMRQAQPTEDAMRRRLDPMVGHVVRISESGQAVVDYPGNILGPVPARTVLNPTVPPSPNTAVLLLFENGDPALPIILGVPREPSMAPPWSVTTPTLTTAQPIVVDVESLLIDARREIVLRCGDGSVTIRSDGKIVVKGTNVLSRSRGLNRIQGGAVRIN